MKFRKRTQNFVDADTTEKVDVKATKQPFTVMRRTAAEIRNYRIIRRIVLISIAVAIAILLIVFGMTMIYTRTGRFSVSIKHPDETFSIALSENTGAGSGGGQMGGDDSADHSGGDGSYQGGGHEGNINNVEKHSRLINDGEKELTNISGDSLPANLDAIYEGDHSEQGYFAYTFFCWNSGKEDVSINYEITFNNVTNGIDECIRLRLYVDGVATDYAKARVDGKGKEPVYCDQPFVENNVVCYGMVPRIIVGDYTRFTIVIWLEGDDPECTDSVIDGTIKFDMQIEALPAIV